MPRPAFRFRLALIALLGATVYCRALAAAEPPSSPLHERIDREIVAALPKWKLDRPAEVADDEEFIRRLTLDLVGVIPRADDVRAFLADQAADKRAKLIDRLLASDEHALHMA